MTGAASTPAKAGHAEAVGQRDHQRHVDAEGLHQRRVLGAGAQVAPSRVRSITNQVPKHTTSEATTTQAR
jgi:hypothetical protein